MANDVQYTLSLKDLLTGKLKEADSAASHLEGTMNVLTGALEALGVTFGIYKLVEFGNEVIDIGAKMESLNNVVKYTSLNAQDAAKNHEFLQHMIRDYKLPIVETTEGFSQFNAALMGSALQGEPARKVFEGVSTAVTALHLNAGQANQVFLALNQMVSKGTVQAQELKLQLGNALPGAFQLAAKAMGMTTAEFTKQVESGNVLANEFLPKFAAKLREQFAGAIPNAIQSTIAKQTDYHNGMIELKNEIFERLHPAINSMYGSLLEVTHALSDGVKWLTEHTEAVKALGVAVGGLVLGLIAYNTYLIAVKIQSGWATLATFAQMVATDGLAASLYAAGVVGGVAWGLMTGGLTLVAAGLYYAYQKSENFRGAINAVWSGIKEFASMAGDLLGGLGKMINGVFMLDTNLIAQGWEQASTSFYEGGLRLGTAINQGFQEGKGLQSSSDVYGDAEKPMFGQKGATAGANAVAETPKTKGVTPKSGGSSVKAVTVNISIGKLIEQFKIETTNIQESTNKIKELVANTILQAVNDASIVANI